MRVRWTLPAAPMIWLAACASAAPPAVVPTPAGGPATAAATAPSTTDTVAQAAAVPARRPVGTSVEAGERPTTGPAVDRAVAAITPAHLHGHLSVLAHDSMRGRDTPSPELDQAARYLAEQFRELGLQPAWQHGFEQRFPLESIALDRELLRVEARASRDTLRPRFGSDLFVLPTRGDSVVGTPYFAGRAQPGATLPANAAGRIVVFFVPDTISPAWQVSVATALQAAMRAQARAAVLVLDSAFSSASLASLAHETQSEVAPIPVIGLGYAAGRDLFRQAGMELGAVRGRTSRQLSPMNGVTLALYAPVTKRSVAVPNVAAFLPGSDPAARDEYVVYSAHFDHVGVGAADAQGDSIYNGADDNASGTSALLAIARAFSTLDQPPARSIMFVLVSGEERGLLGSRFFVENPPVPVERMVANINADMIGRNAPDTVVAIGQDYSTLGPAAQHVAERHPELGLIVAPDLWPEEQLFFRSDHFSFAAQGIPAIFFTTGLHDEYHRPGDVVELIDTDKLARISQLLFRLGLEIAQQPERPEWTEEGRARVPRAGGN